MIEINKMLHLRKYALIVIKNHVQSHVSRSLHSTSLHNSMYRRGYFSYSMQKCSEQSMRVNYAVNIKRQCTTTITQSSVDDIEQKVMSLCDNVNHDQVSVDKLKEVIQSCYEGDYEMHPNTGMLLLKCCGNVLSNATANERQELADRVWNLMKKNSNALTLEHYNTMLEICMENSNSIDVTKFLADMNVEPDSKTYRLLLNAAAKINNIDNIQDIITMMKEKNAAFEENTFHTVIQILMSNGKGAEAERVIMYVKDSKLPTNKLYTELACEYAKQGNISSLCCLLENEIFGSTDLLKIIKVLSIANESKYIPTILNFLKPSIPTIELSDMLEIITQLVYVNRVADANTILTYIISNGAIAENMQCFIKKFLNELFMINTPIKHVINFTNIFEEYKSSSFQYIAETALKLGKEAPCLEIFAAMREVGIEIRPHYYWPLLISAYRNVGETNIYSLIESMVATGVEIDFDTLKNYVYPFVNTAKPIITVQRLEQMNVSPYILYTPMLYFLLSNGRLTDAIHLCQYNNVKVDFKVLLKPLVRIYLDTRNIHNCLMMLMMYLEGRNYISTFLLMLLKQNRFSMDDLQSLLEAIIMHKGKILQYDSVFIKGKIDNTNFAYDTKMKLHHMVNSMIDINIKDSPSAFITRIKYMNTKELACYLVESKSQNYSTRSVLYNLLKGYCQENNLKKAEEVKQLFYKDRLQWTPGMHLSLFELYVRHNKLESANNILIEIHNLSKTFVISADKLLKFAIALVKAGRPKMAYKIIEKYMYDSHKSHLQIYCQELLNTMVQQKYYNSVDSMLKLLLEKMYLDIDSNILRLFVMIPLEQSDISAAVDTLEKYANKYNKLPAVLEVMTALLREDTTTNVRKNDIQRVYNIICNVKDNEVATTVLVIALAKLNKEEEMQNILQKQTISMESLIKYCKDIQSAAEIDSAFRILKAIPVTDTSKQIDLCNLLLTAYSKTSDCKNALALWDMMCEKNIKPNKAFQEDFLQLLVANKIRFPSEFELNEARKIN